MQETKMEMTEEQQRPASTSAPKRRCGNRCCWIVCGVSVGLILFLGLAYWKFFMPQPPPPGYGPPPGYMQPPPPQQPPQAEAADYY